MELELLVEDESALLSRFPHKHGPFRSKNDVYRWYKRLLGNGSLYFGKGLQRNVLKGGGGGQDAWYGVIQRAEDGVYFYGPRQLPFTPVQARSSGYDQYEVQPQPISLTEFQKMLADGFDEDTVLATAIERGITKKLGRFVTTSDTLSDILKMEMAEHFDLADDSEPLPTNASRPRKVGRYGVDTDDFAAAVIDGHTDEDLADMFGIRPAQSKILRMQMNMKFGHGRPRTYDHSEIERLHRDGMSDDDIAVRLGATASTIAHVTAPLRLDAIEDGIKQGKSALAIAAALNMPLKIVQRIINQHHERERDRPWCKVHKISHNSRYGCPHCREG